jgi:hypothetical protein
MTMPAHPGSDDTTHHDSPATPGGRGPAVFIAIVAVVFVVMIILHLSGVVGPGGH